MKTTKKYNWKRIFANFKKHYKRPTNKETEAIVEEFICNKMEEALSDALELKANLENIVLAMYNILQYQANNGYLERFFIASPNLEGLDQNLIDESFEIWKDFIENLKTISFEDYKNSLNINYQLPEFNNLIALGVYRENAILGIEGKITIYELFERQPLIFSQSKV